MKNKWIMGICLVFSALLTMLATGDTCTQTPSSIPPCGTVCRVYEAQPVRKAIAQIHRMYKQLSSDLIHNDPSQTQSDKNLLKSICRTIENMPVCPPCIGKIPPTYDNTPLQYKGGRYVYRLHKILI